MRRPSGAPLTRETLALRLRQNWLAKHPLDVPTCASSLDDSLTSLNWLQNLNIMKITTPTPPSSPDTQEHITLQTSPLFSSNAQVNPNAILNMTNLPPGQRVKQEPGIFASTQFRTISGIDMAAPIFNGLEKIDYKTNPHVKPPYSYATLICMAMRESKKQKITLSGIYNWITDNFMYYRMADPSWQNSIRHNLSLNKCFQKVPRRKDEPGKGGFWRINPEFQDMFVNGIFKKRRCSTASPATREPQLAPPPLKRIKREDDDNSNSSIASLSGLAAAGVMPGMLTPMNSVEETEDAVRAIEIKREPSLNYSGTFKSTTDADLSEAIDFSWNVILNQDIEVGGVKVKTEDIIDDTDGDASPITALSPPPSDNSSDISFEDLLNTDFSNELDTPLDLTCGSALDLTISGVGLKAPEWWEESINEKTGFMISGNRSRMNTPIAQIDDSDFAHPWAEDKSESEIAMAIFDKDFGNLFDLLENVPSPKLAVDS